VRCERLCWQGPVRAVPFVCGVQIDGKHHRGLLRTPFIGNRCCYGATQRAPVRSGPVAVVESFGVSQLWWRHVRDRRLRQQTGAEYMTGGCGHDSLGEIGANFGAGSDGRYGLFCTNPVCKVEKNAERCLKQLDDLPRPVAHLGKPAEGLIERPCRKPNKRKAEDILQTLGIIEKDKLCPDLPKEMLIPLPAPLSVEDARDTRSKQSERIGRGGEPRADFFCRVDTL